MKVYYTFDKVGGRWKKQCLTVLYENSSWIPRRTYDSVFKRYNQPFYTRPQIDGEVKDGERAWRMFSNYQYFFDKYHSIDDLINQCIKDDCVLREDPEQAESFTKEIWVALERAYPGERQFRKRKLKNPAAERNVFIQAKLF